MQPVPKYKVGDILRCKSDGARGAGCRPGETFQVSSITFGNTPNSIQCEHIYWGNVGGGVFESSVELASNNNISMNNVSNYTQQFVDADTQALIKAGYLSEKLEPTAKAVAKVAEINFFANKAELVKSAKAEIEKAEACKK